MADREMPNLKSRLTLDSSDLPRAKAEIERLQQSTAQGTKTVSDSRRKADELLAELAAERARVGGLLEEASTSAAAGIDTAANSAEQAAGAVAQLDEGLDGAATGLVSIAGVAQQAGQALNALRAGQTAAAGATAGLAQSVGTGNLVMAGLAVGATAVTLGMQLFANSDEHAREQQEALNKALDDGVGKIDATREAIGEYLLTAEDAFFTPEQLEQLRAAGLTIDDLHAGLRQGLPSLDDYIAKLESAGKVYEVVGDGATQYTDAQGRLVDANQKVVEVNGRFFVDNEKLIDSQRDLIKTANDEAKVKSEQLVINDAITQARLDELVATNELADGTTNWIAVNQAANQQLANAAAATERATAATEAATAAIADRVAAEIAFRQAQVDAVNKSITAGFTEGQAAASLKTALEQVDEALGKGTKSRAAALKVSESAEAAARREAQAERQVQSARDAVADSNERLAESEEKVAAARASLDEVTNVTVAREQAAAARDIADANDRVAAAQEKVIDAQRRLDEALRGPSTRDVTKADIARQEALDQLEAAEQRVADATRLRDRSLLSANPRRRAAAEEELSDAIRDRESAEIRATEATEKHDELAGFSAETSGDVADARHAVEQAERDVARAQVDAATTQQKLLDQLGPNLDGSKLIEEARRKVAKAEEEVRDRTQDVERRVRDLADVQEQRLTPTTQAAVQPAKDLGAAYDAVEQAMFRVSQTAVETAITQATLRGETLTAGDQAGIQRDKLIELQGTLAPDSPLRQRLQGYIDALGHLPASKDVSLVLKTDDALAAFEAFLLRVQEQIDRGYDPNQRANDPNFTGNRQSRAGGGRVSAGVDYLVNDGSRREVFRPDVSGRMVVDDGLTPIGGGGVMVAEGAVQVSVSLAGPVDEFDLRRVRTAVREEVAGALDEVLAGARR